ncbi:uncharacterized protein LOC103717938 isoform X1 [Phoenix dactylifera]|uniref:Uncharacterized protein LOC103717938 isoform X1 n=1 Tax=Phoenix dactylifera TaxID=42345 RepID=A0A8B8JA74_PHODC|nr:uncharacterized protein LOC103717938 isoform X1 [Phoenix dactylifera]
MDGEAKRNNGLQSLLEAINSTEILESRTALISQLGDSCQSETSDQTLLFEYLVTFWNDSPCLGASQCMLNKVILHVAAKYLESDMSDCPRQFLILGMKASVWCQKHLLVTLESSDELQDENHSSLFFQLILDSLSFSSTTISLLTRSPFRGDKAVMLIVENFVVELLSFTKTIILEIKKIHSIASEVLKVAQVVLDAAIKLCRAYSQATKWDCYEINVDRNEGSKDDKMMDYCSHIISITVCTIENLYELGIFAASGGSLASVLNVSWKGVVSLLQLGKGVLAEKIVVGNIILTLVSLAIESLKCASQALSATLQETLAISEAKRTFLPIKFYLINAVRISSEFPCEAINIHKEITRCVLLISSLGIYFSKDTHLRAASEALVEFLEPTSFLLLHTLLNSAEIKPESKFLIMDWLFKDEIESDSIDLENNVNTAAKSTSLDSLFTVDSDAIPRTKTLMLGRVIVFLYLLKTSTVLREEMVLGISRKLECLLNILMHEEVYSSILGLQIPVLCGFGANPGVVWQSMLSSVLHALKTFIIVSSSLDPAWMEVETFLYENLFHPHFLCVEIVTELWGFIMRHAETDMVNCILNRLFLFLKMIASSEPALTPNSALRKMSRSICVLLTYAPVAIVDHVSTSILSDNSTFLSSVIYLALLMEGFPLDSLSDNIKSLATQKIVTAFYGFMETNSSELALNISPGSCSSSLPGLPVYALSSALRCCHIKNSDLIDEKKTLKVLKFMLSVIHGYKSAIDAVKDHYARLLGMTLDIISNMKHLFGSDEFAKVILELHTIFASGSADADSFLYQCKPSLASFMAGLSHMEIAEGEGSALCSAIWELYHVLLRERHWAFIHLAIASFGYFAARTSCTQLWRFVPHDAALSYNTDTGNETNEDRFMSELKGFLEKEVALNEVTPSEEQLSLLDKEGITLKKLSKLLNTIPQVSGSETMEMNAESCVNKKKRKLPDGICEGMELLQSGLKVMRNALCQADSVGLRDEISTQISCLEDVISRLMVLSDNV